MKKRYNLKQIGNLFILAILFLLMNSAIISGIDDYVSETPIEDYVSGAPKEDYVTETPKEDVVSNVPKEDYVSNKSKEGDVSEATEENLISNLKNISPLNPLFWLVILSIAGLILLLFIKEVKKIIFILVIILILSIVILLVFNSLKKDSTSKIKGMDDLIKGEGTIPSFTIDLPERFENSVKMNMLTFHTVFAVCYLRASAAMAKYLEEVPFDEFVWYARPFEFKFKKAVISVRAGPGAEEQTTEGFYNLGYTVHHVNSAGKVEAAILMKRETADSYSFVKTQKEAFNLLKRLISVGIPVRIIVPGSFVEVIGYNETHVIMPPFWDPVLEDFLPHDFDPRFVETYIPNALSLKFSDEAVLYNITQAIPNKQFLKMWQRAAGNSLTWFEKTHERKSKEEMFEINKNDAKEAAQNLRKFLENFDYKWYTSDGDGAIFVAAGSRYLKKEGYNDLAEKYMEIASKYNDLEPTKGSTQEERNDLEPHESLTQEERIAKYLEIAQLYEEAANLWP